MDSFALYATNIRNKKSVIVDYQDDNAIQMNYLDILSSGSVLGDVEDVVNRYVTIDKSCYK